MPIRLTEEEFAELVDKALREVPEPFRPHMEDLVVEVHPRPTRRLVGRGPRGWSSLLGLYHGVPLTDRSVEALVRWPERILIFQRNIEAICRTRRDVVEQVRKTVLHEIGHHFGMDEDDLDELGYQ